MIDELREIYAELFPTRHADIWEPSDADLVVGEYFARRLKAAEEEIRLLKRNFLKP